MWYRNAITLLLIGLSISACGVQTAEVVICPADLPTVELIPFPEGDPATVHELQVAWIKAESAYADLEEEYQTTVQAWQACKKIAK